MIDKYSMDITASLNTFYQSRSKRWVYGPLTTFSVSNIKTVVGTPVLEGKFLYFTYYIESGMSDLLIDNSNHFNTSIATG